jgi:type I restriction enzyme S subunit
MFSGRCLRVRVTTEDVLPAYLYYYFTQNSFRQYVRNNAVGATMPSLNSSILRRLKILYPSLSKQKQVNDILSTIDDTLANNYTRIQLLEESARLLFREWFVYFRFPRLRQGYGGQAGHEKACPVESINSTGVKIVDGVPEGWKKEKLIKIGYLNYGKALVEETREEGDVKVYGSSGVVGVHSKSLVEGPGIIVGRKGNVGAIHWVNDSYWPIDTVYYIKKEQSNLFLYLSLKIIGFINTDASVPGLNRDYAHNKTILVPTKDLLDKFLNQVNDIYSMVKILTIQNQKLAQARDLLLPRLMSGAIDPVRYDKLSNGVDPI